MHTRLRRYIRVRTDRATAADAADAVSEWIAEVGAGNAIGIISRRSGLLT